MCPLPFLYTQTQRPNRVCQCLFFMSQLKSGIRLCFPVTLATLTHPIVNKLSSFFRRVCYYFGGWHTQVITSELWWLSLFGADSRLIGPISSWVDVPGAEHNLIRQRRAALPLGLSCGGRKRKSPRPCWAGHRRNSSYGDCWAYGNCHQGIVGLTAPCVFVCTCVCLRWCEWKNVRYVMLFFLSFSCTAQVQLSSAVATVTSFAISCIYLGDETTGARRLSNAQWVWEILCEEAIQRLASQLSQISPYHNCTWKTTC